MVNSKKTLKKPNKVQKASKISGASKISSFTKNSRSHSHFLVILILFASFSVYALMSFVGSTNDYINNMYSSVVGGPEGAGGDEVALAPVDEAVVPVDESAQLFTDLPVGHYNEQAIKSLYHAGIMNGYDDGSFRPDDFINRAELLVVLTTAVDADFAGRAYGNCFNDVKDQWFSVFVCYGKEQGWIKGFEDGNYRPGQSVTKPEVLKIVFSVFDYPICDTVTEKPFEDVELDSWYAPYACAAKKDGIIWTGGLFDENYKITRGDYAQIVYNVMVKKGLLAQ